jgi:hypothetical protein
VSRPPAADASPVVAALPAGTSRPELLQAANAAYTRNDVAQATALYRQVMAARPGPDESAEQTQDLTDFAEFRLLLTLVAAGDQAGAARLVGALQANAKASPFTRLAGQFWDQYGMSASLTGACAQVQPQVASQAGTQLAALRALGVAIPESAVCQPPGS